MSGLADENEEPNLEDLAEAIRRLDIAPFLLSTVSTLTSLAYGKIEEGKLEQAKMAIDGVGALMPVLSGHVDEELLRDFDRALANVRVAYADAASGPPD